jgi:putative transcriptional regulator
MPLHNQVKRYREEKGISQTELGKLCGVSRQTISSIERGDYHPSVVLALRIAFIFGKKVEDLFCWEEDSDEEV